MRTAFALLSTLLPLLLSSLAAFEAQARVSTAPTSPDQRLINPAAASARKYLGFSLDLHRDLETSKVLNLIDSTAEISTQVDSLNAGQVGRSGAFTWEIAVSPQMGEKKTTSSFQEVGFSNVVSDSTLGLVTVPAEALVGFRLRRDFSVGLRLLYAQAQFEGTNNYAFIVNESRETTTERVKFNGQFLVVSPGILYELGSTGFSLAYVAETFFFNNEQNNSGTRTTGGNEAISTSTIEVRSRDSLTIRKNIFGIGYQSSKSTQGNSIRFDLSIEKMPPLSKNPYALEGELLRAIVELNFSYFRVGAEWSRQKGYYVDPTNLVPYFFNVDQFSDQAVDDIGFFGGLRTSKGHGFGLSFSQSTTIALEALSFAGTPQELEKKNTTYSVSYSYVF